MKNELEMYKEFDPKLFKEKSKILVTLEEQTEIARSGVNRWTDNIFTIQSYCTNKFMLPKSDFNKQFQISDELDYIE